MDVLSPGEVRQAARVPMGEPLARVSLEAIEARVESLAPVQVVDVSRSWPNQLRIAVLAGHARNFTITVEC